MDGPRCEEWKSLDESNNVTERPTYAGAFRCIGPECEDTCCQGWDIPVDKATYERYQLFPVDRLGWAVAGFVTPTSGNVPSKLFAHIHMTASGECPFYEADHLCGIHKTYGAKMLSSSCSSYPRALNRVHGLLEGSLSMSCPEAARNVLLNPDFLNKTTNLEAGEFRTDNFFWLRSEATGASPKPFGAFDVVRSTVIGMVRDRSRPMWLRLLRVGLLCKRLEQEPQAETAIAEVLRGDIDGELIALASNPSLRLEVAMRFTDERVRDKSAGRRFQETYWSFIEGIAVGADGGDDLERLQWSERNHYRPFMEAHPYILENLLVNYIYQRLFPFGRAGGVTLRERGMFEEFVLLATQFGWMEVLLYGVSGRYREEFGGHHVVEAVQTFHRAVEHYAHVLEEVLAVMRQRGMDDLSGMAVMLRA